MATKTIALRIDEDLLEVISKRAEKENRTLSNMIITILLDNSRKMSESNEEYAINELRLNKSIIQKQTVKTESIIKYTKDLEKFKTTSDKNTSERFDFMIDSIRNMLDSVLHGDFD